MESTPKYEIDEDTVPEIIGPVSAPEASSTSLHNGLVMPRSQFPRVVQGTNVILEEEGGHKRYTATVIQVNDAEVYLAVDWTSPIEVVDPEANVW